MGAFELLPARVFLDTSVVNFWLDNTDHIHEGVEIDADTPARVANDIDALKWIYLTGQRAAWQLIVSPLTHQEVVATRDPTRREELVQWFLEIWSYANECMGERCISEPSDPEVARPLSLESDSIMILPDDADRRLLLAAVTYGCDAFCTRDWSTILRHRKILTNYPIPIITPTEWWKQIQPWSGLWF